MKQKQSNTPSNRLEIVDSRSEFIIKQIRGKRVLHIGCADSGCYDQRKQYGGFLHQILEKDAGVIYGVDIDAAGIERMKKDGYKNIYNLDITKNSDLNVLFKKLRKAGGIDVAVAGEVIEHVPNPIIFASALLKIKKEFGSLCILTTPNPFYFGSFLKAALGKEIVHPDHNYYFSIGTLSTVLKKAGLKTEPEFIAYLNLPHSVHRRLMKRLITKISPLYSDGIIVIF